MTTAHKPTFHPAMGTENQGGYRYPTRRLQFSALDLPSYKKMKFRQEGQNAPEEMTQRDLLAELEMKEKAHDKKLAIEKKVAENGVGEIQAEEIKVGQLQAGQFIAGEAKNTKSLSIDAPSIPSLDEQIEERVKDYDDADSYDSESSSSSESDDEEKELLAELEKIKKERKEEAEGKRMEEESEVEKDQLSRAMEENPLLFSKDLFDVKERWDHDIVFRNQAKEEPKDRPRFINDTIRNDFHRKFMRKYVR